MAADQQELMRSVTLDEVMNALLYGAEICARKASEEDRAAEAKDYASASLQLVQAHITLDPTRLTGGDVAVERKAALPDPVPSTRDTDRDGQLNEK